MVLHTIVSEYDIFREKTEPRRGCRRLDGVYLEGEDADGVFRVDRIISTNPADYLDGRHTLGERLK